MLAGLVIYLNIAVDVGCPTGMTGWFYHGNYCYSVQYQSANKYHAAQRACIDLGANLTSVNSADEQIFLNRKYIQNRT